MSSRLSETPRWILSFLTPKLPLRSQTKGLVVHITLLFSLQKRRMKAESFPQDTASKIGKIRNFSLSLLARFGDVFTCRRICRHVYKGAQNESSRSEILQQLRNATVSESLAVAFFESQRWSSTPCCPLCGDTNVYMMMTGEKLNKDYGWRCRGCKQMYSVRVGRDAAPFDGLGERRDLSSRDR